MKDKYQDNSTEGILGTTTTKYNSNNKKGNLKMRDSEATEKKFVITQLRYAKGLQT